MGAIYKLFIKKFYRIYSIRTGEIRYASIITNVTCSKQ